MLRSYATFECVVHIRQPTARNSDDEEADKSYTYMIDGRGFALTDAVGVTAAVEEAGVSDAALTLAQVLPDGKYTEGRFGLKV